MTIWGTSRYIITTVKKHQKLLDRFVEVKQKVKVLIDQFPKQKRNEVLFDKWSLKDVVAHLSAWMEDDLKALRNLKKGKKTFWEPDLDAFNEKGVSTRKGKSWDAVYKEFTDLIEDLNNEYLSLSEELFNTEMWKNHKGTPARSLKVDIRHWEEEHIPSLTKVLEKF